MENKFTFFKNNLSCRIYYTAHQHLGSARRKLPRRGIRIYKMLSGSWAQQDMQDKCQLPTVVCGLLSVSGREELTD